tara:strand:+ start:190 stop:606 length:417 start_codon:yes stop_codon:yes gene_type:complete
VTSKYRSGLERRIGDFLNFNKQPFTYEPKGLWVKYEKPTSKYKPDFILNNGIIIEAKGLFKGSDRSKHLLIKRQHPNLDIRFVFSNSNSKLSKASKTSYRKWCDKNGFQYADKMIPKSWMLEKPITKRLKAIEECYEQ